MSDQEVDAKSPNAEETIVALVTRRGVGKTICPTEAARLIGGADDGKTDRWRRALPGVRAAAVRLAKAGVISIYRKGRPVDPDSFKGVYRLGLPGKVLP